MSKSRARVGIVMGSKSDWPVVEAARKILDDFEVGSEVRILSAHRTPAEACDWARGARGRGLEVLIGAAGGAAHLPGVIAAHTTLPVIGVPIANGPLSGFDSLLAIVQMPKGIPVATVGVGSAVNAALLALQIMATADDDIRARLEAYKVDMAARVVDTDRELQAELS